MSNTLDPSTNEEREDVERLAKKEAALNELSAKLDECVDAWLEFYFQRQQKFSDMSKLRASMLEDLTFFIGERRRNFEVLRTRKLARYNEDASKTFRRCLDIEATYQELLLNSEKIPQMAINHRKTMAEGQASTGGTPVTKRVNDILHRAG